MPPQSDLFPKNMLVINPAASRHSGIYTCYGTKVGGGHFLARAQLKVYGMSAASSFFVCDC